MVGNTKKMNAKRVWMSEFHHVICCVVGIVVPSCSMQIGTSASTQSTLGLVAFFEESIDAFQALILLRVLLRLGRRRHAFISVRL